MSHPRPLSRLLLVFVHNNKIKQQINVTNYPSSQRTLTIGWKYHCTAGLQFYKFGFNCCTRYVQITTCLFFGQTLSWKFYVDI